jgi:hypothetical protein
MRGTGFLVFLDFPVGLTTRAVKAVAAVSGHDETGQGREVTALTADAAAIRWPSGSITIYHKNNKPALGPVGDSLDDFK